MKLGQKSVKNLVGFLGDLKTSKFNSEIDRSLEKARSDINVCQNCYKLHIFTPQIRNPNVGANVWCKGCMHVTRSNLVEPLTEKKMSRDRKNVNHEEQTKKKDIKQKIRVVFHSQLLILCKVSTFQGHKFIFKLTI